MNDPIADMLSRIRNALMARHETVDVPYSSVKSQLARILEKEGYVEKVAELDTKPQKTLHITLKYGPDRSSVIQGVQRASTPGSRKYVKASALSDIQVRRGLGTAVVSTSRGMMTDHDARKLNVGGGIICRIW